MTEESGKTLFSEKTGCAPGNPFFRALRRANTRLGYSPVFYGRHDAVCGVCLPVRKTVPVCSGNHTGEPVHPQDSLPARALLSFPSARPPSPSLSLHVSSSFHLDSLSSIYVSLLHRSSFYPAPNDSRSSSPLAALSTSILSRGTAFLSVSSFNSGAPFETSRCNSSLMDSNNVQRTRARIHTRGNVTPDA